LLPRPNSTYTGSCILFCNYKRNGEEEEKTDQGNLTSIAVQNQTESHGHSHSNAKGESGGNLNMRGVFLHVMADALGSVIVIISALIMWKAPEWKFTDYVDPGLSLIMVMLMMWSVWPLLIESALILLQTVPTHIDIDLLKRKLLESIDGILAVSKGKANCVIWGASHSSFIYHLLNDFLC
jgi:zinc transporter 1